MEIKNNNRIKILLVTVAVIALVAFVVTFLLIKKEQNNENKFTKTEQKSVNDNRQNVNAVDQKVIDSLTAPQSNGSNEINDGQATQNNTQVDQKVIDSISVSTTPATNSTVSGSANPPVTATIDPKVLESLSSSAK